MLHAISIRLRKLFDRIFDNVIFRRLVKNSGYLFSSTGISAVLSMVQGILVARLLGVENYGILAAIITFTSTINNFASFRMSELVIKYVGHYSEVGDQPRAAAVFKAAALAEVAASFVAFGLVYLLAPLGARYLAKDPNTANLFVFYGVVLLANLIPESSTGLLQTFDRFRRMSGLVVAASLITLALIIVVYLLHGSLAGILFAYLAGKVIGSAGLTAAALIEASHRWGRDWWRAPVNLLRRQGGELAHFAINTNLSASLSLITKDNEVLWVSLFRNPVEAGYYKLALTLTNFVEMPVSPLPQATYPELSRLAARQRWDNFRYILRQGSIMAGVYSLVATLFLVLFGRPLIAFFYTPEFLPAYPALLILLAGYLVANIFYWRRSALLALGHAGYPTKLNLVLAALKLIGILIFVPKYGYLACAALLAGFYWVGSIASLIKIRAVLPQQVEAS